MTCSKCGNQLPDNAVFCPACGNKTDAPEVQAQPQQPYPQGSYPPPPPPGYQYPYYPPKPPSEGFLVLGTKLIATILKIFSLVLALFGLIIFIVYLAQRGPFVGALSSLLSMWSWTLLLFAFAEFMVFIEKKLK